MFSSKSEMQSLLLIILLLPVYECETLLLFLFPQPLHIFLRGSVSMRMINSSFIYYSSGQGFKCILGLFVFQ